MTNYNRNDYDQNRYLERIKAAYTLLGGKCVACGSIEDLQFDHVDPLTKLFNITNGTGFSNQKFLTELAKCQLLCQPHHAEKSKTEFVYGRNNGENNGGSKLRELDVLYIRGLFELGHSLTHISKEFNIGMTTTHNIVHRNSWKHVR